MKLSVSMKDPDVLHDAIREAVVKEVSAMQGVDKDERESIVELRMEKVCRLCEKWFEYSEYLNVEIDTDAMTCIVVPVK